MRASPSGFLSVLFARIATSLADGAAAAAAFAVLATAPGEPMDIGVMGLVFTAVAAAFVLGVVIGAALRQASSKTGAAIALCGQVVLLAAAGILFLSTQREAAIIVSVMASGVANAAFAPGLTAKAGLLFVLEHLVEIGHGAARLLTDKRANRLWPPVGALALTGAGGVLGIAFFQIAGAIAWLSAAALAGAAAALAARTGKTSQPPA